MKLNLKTLLLIVLIGSLPYLYKNYIKYKNSLNKSIAQIQQKDTIKELIDKKSSKSPTPKALDFIHKHHNKLETGGNWHSK